MSDDIDGYLISAPVASIEIQDGSVILIPEGFEKDEMIEVTEIDTLKERVDPVDTKPKKKGRKKKNENKANTNSNGNNKPEKGSLPTDSGEGTVRSSNTDNEPGDQIPAEESGQTDKAKGGVE